MIDIKNMTKLFNSLLILFTALSSANLLDAKTKDEYLSLSSKAVNMRVGPGKNYPINWHYNAKGLPVLVKARLHEWVQVVDHENIEGWVHKDLLSSSPTLITVSAVTFVYKSDNTKSKVIAKIEKNVICHVLKKKDNWIKIKVDNVKGWALKSDVWGDVQ